jgi:hypothetical protein
VQAGGAGGGLGGGRGGRKDDDEEKTFGGETHRIPKVGQKVNKMFSELSDDIKSLVHEHGGYEQDRDQDRNGADMVNMLVNDERR